MTINEKQIVNNLIKQNHIKASNEYTRKIKKYNQIKKRKDNLENIMLGMFIMIMPLIIFFITFIDSII